MTYIRSYNSPWGWGNKHWIKFPKTNFGKRPLSYLTKTCLTGNRNGKAHSRCDSEGGLGSGSLSFLVPVNDFLGLAQGCNLGKVWTVGLFSFSLDHYPHSIVLHHSTLPPSFLLLWPRKAKVHLLVCDNLWNHGHSNSIQLSISTLFIVWIICEDTRVLCLFASQRQCPVMTKSTDPGTQVLEPNCLSLNSISTAHYLYDLKQVT